jgi:tRNA-uridine 2-sulfurtransferase
MPSSELVIIGMSGGVDSSVAAWRLLQQGYEVQGLFMSNWEDDDVYCTAAQDYQDARQVCARLEIPLHKVDFSKDYRQRVFDHFLAEYRAGRTPNPDVLCNREIKFGVCFDYARRLGADLVATGHYARIEHSPVPRLLKAIDAGKDQSYFLHSVAAEALAHTRFPIGDLHKAEVRRIAMDLALPVFDKKDSTGICFIGERPFREFLQQYLPGGPGDIESLDGRKLGRHHGLMYYTLGQRQGLGIGGDQQSTGEPWYVADKDLERNVLRVVQGSNHPALLQQDLSAIDATWIAGRPPAERFACTAKVRYRQHDQPCQVAVLADGRCEVRFATLQRAITPGQYVVFYQQDACLGGAVIERAWSDSTLE